MLAGAPGMFGGDRQQRRQQRAETARRYAEWLGESESVASWQSQAQITSERLLDDGNTLVLRRWPRRQVVAEQVLAAQQRLAFAKGALSERLGSDTSPLWEFGFDNCHEIFEVHAPLIRQVFLGFQWDIAVVADPTIRLEVTRRRTEEPDDEEALDPVARALAEERLANASARAQQALHQEQLRRGCRPSDIGALGARDEEAEKRHCALM